MNLQFSFLSVRQQSPRVKSQGLAIIRVKETFEYNDSTESDAESSVQWLGRSLVLLKKVGLYTTSKSLLCNSNIWQLFSQIWKLQYNIANTILQIQIQETIFNAQNGINQCLFILNFKDKNIWTFEGKTWFRRRI